MDANVFAERPKMWPEWAWERRWRAGTAVSPGEAPNGIGRGDEPLKGCFIDVSIVMLVMDQVRSDTVED